MRWPAAAPATRTRSTFRTCRRGPRKPVRPRSCALAYAGADFDRAAGVEPQLGLIADLDAGDPQNRVVGVDEQRQPVAVKARHVAALQVAAQFERRLAAERLPLAAAAGRLAAEPLCPYPPGIPLLIPGERIDAARRDWLLEQQRLWPGQIADTVKVVA